MTARAITLIGGASRPGIESGAVLAAPGTEVLDAEDLRICLSLVAGALHHHPDPPQTLRRTHERLARLVAGASPRGQQIRCARPESIDMETIGTRQAASILDWSQRSVRRHATDFDGRLVGNRWVFDAQAVHRYAAECRESSSTN